MRILHINSYYLSSTLYKHLEESINKNRYKQNTYVPVSYSFTARKEIDYKLPNHVNVQRCYGNIERFFFHIKQLRIYGNFKKQYSLKNYDIIHAHSLFSNGYIANSIFKKYNIPFIVAVRSTDINIFFKRMIHLRKIGIEILNNASKIIFLSHPYKKESIKTYVPDSLKEKISNKSYVIPNGVDDYWHKNKTNKCLKLEEKIKLIFVGNDSKNKNLKQLVKACEILRSRNYDVRLNVVGSISNKYISKHLQSKSYIKIKGHVNKYELLKLYRKSHIFVLASLTETFGLVYPEALSQGLPIIYTENQGFDGYFSDGYIGYSVRSLDPEDIANKIMKIKANYCSMTKRTYKSIEQFRWSEIALKYERVYEETLIENNAKNGCD